jgi:hypothetical protein
MMLRVVAIDLLIAFCDCAVPVVCWQGWAILVVTLSALPKGGEAVGALIHADGVFNAVTSDYPGSHKREVGHRVTQVTLPPALGPLYISG